MFRATRSITKSAPAVCTGTVKRSPLTLMKSMCPCPCPCVAESQCGLKDFVTLSRPWTMKAYTAGVPLRPARVLKLKWTTHSSAGAVMPTWTPTKAMNPLKTASKIGIGREQKWPMVIPAWSTMCGPNKGLAELWRNAFHRMAVTPRSQHQCDTTCLLRAGGFRGACAVSRAKRQKCLAP